MCRCLDFYCERADQKVSGDVRWNAATQRSLGLGDASDAIWNLTGLEVNGGRALLGNVRLQRPVNRPAVHVHGCHLPLGAGPTETGLLSPFRHGN